MIEKEGIEDCISAREVCAKLLSHVCCCTEQKRRFLEQADRDDHSAVNKNKHMRKAREREIARTMRDMPGKLDHAAVVAFEVGYFSEEGEGQSQPQKVQTKKSLRGMFSELISRRNSGSSPGHSEPGTPCSEGSDSFVELYSLLGV